MSSSNSAKPSAGGSSASSPKKRRFVAPPPAPAGPPPTTQNVRLWHQDIQLETIYYGNQWHCQAKTVLYVENMSNASSMALHLRRTCHINKLTVEQMDPSTQRLVALDSRYTHMDPLAHLLRKPPTTYYQSSSNETTSPPRCEADAHVCRGASGVMTRLRAASIASEAGQVRIYWTTTTASTESATQTPNVASWRHYLDASSTCDTSTSAASKLQEELHARSSDTRSSRCDLIARKLASSKSNRAYRITVEYEIPLDGKQRHHLGGIHFLHSPAPHVYTTTGAAVGDHEGPNHWVPTCDSASSQHRASRTMTVYVSALCPQGLSAVGCGQDFGIQKTLLHDFLQWTSPLSSSADVKQVLTSRHVDFLTRVTTKASTSSNAHVIPPEVATLDSIWATHIWTTQIWTPVPARSLGFAIGPFTVLEDPEYFSVEEDNDDDEEEDDNDGGDSGDGMDWEEEKQLIEQARLLGQGFRQVYFAPLCERRLLHLDKNNPDMTLLPNTSFQRLQEKPSSHSLLIEKTVTSCTTGVAHRALSLMRDILALPSYRTTSYTQIWIPNALQGGATCGSLHSCPEVAGCNAWVGAALMDARLLPPIGKRLPYHAGGRMLQCLQARNAIRGWIVAALPLGGHDDVGYGYLYVVIESLLMSLYERGHGAQGEGGAKGSVYFAKRYAVTSGLNSSNLDFLPINNIEEIEFDTFGGLVGAIPTEERNNNTLFRTAMNGSESHTSAQDEYSMRQTLIADIVEALERGTDLDKNVPLPSFGWTGSHLSLSFLSSTASSSTELGCGAVELVHPIGGLLYRTVKADVFRRLTDGRVGIQNLVRIIRAGFIAAHLEDGGETKLQWGARSPRKQGTEKKADEAEIKIRPPFVECVDKLLSTGGFTHTIFTTGIRTLAGSLGSKNLSGTLGFDVERNSAALNRQVLLPEGYPNAFVRGASMPYHRVGVHVEPPAGESGAAILKSTQLHVLVEPAIPDGGIAFGGLVTLRIVENNGQIQELQREFANGCRKDWGPVILRASKPVTTLKEQNAASGIIEAASSTKDKKDKSKDKEKQKEKPALVAFADGSAFNENLLHFGGFQALELVRLTNRSPLLWIRVDPNSQFCGKTSVFQPDACVAEQLFHDGEASAQIEAIRTLAERPLRIQGSVKITTVHNVKVSELPVRVLGDCLRGTPALHGDLPHTACVRAHAALGIAQWQNNKSPPSKDSVDNESWLGLNLLMQYFKERFSKNGIIMPAKFIRICVKNTEAEARQKSDAGLKRKSDGYVYLDSVDGIADAEEIDEEDDEEHRVRSAVLSAIAAVRAKDGMTPPAATKFMLAVLDASDESVVGTNTAPDEDEILEVIRLRQKASDDGDEKDLRDPDVSRLPFVPSSMIADALLAVCHINVSPSVIRDPVTGKPVQATIQHPIQPLLKASRKWLEWELYRETVRTEMDMESQTGIGGNCYDSVSACGLAALSTLAILRQSTTDQSNESAVGDSKDVAIGAQFYMNVFDEEPRRSDVTRAACAQAVACVCCAADRFEGPSPPLGLLTSLEYMLTKIADPDNSPALRQTLAHLMIDVCTGKVSSMQRVASIGGKGDLCQAGARFYTGPLGATSGSDNGSALLMTVNGVTNPVATAVNDGARRGLKLLRNVGLPKYEARDEIVVRVATFMTNLWRLMNGHCISFSEQQPLDTSSDGVCANDGVLRCTILSLWQWICPKTCHPIMKVQSWRSHEDTPRYKALGAHKVLKVYDEETAAVIAEEKSLEPLVKIVQAEVDRQTWRGEMITKAYESTMASKSKAGAILKDESGVGELLPPVLRDPAFKQGGWVTSTSRQRRAMHLDGGIAVTKVNLRVKGSES